MQEKTHKYSNFENREQKFGSVWSRVLVVPELEKVEDEQCKNALWSIEGELEQILVYIVGSKIEQFKWSSLQLDWVIIALSTRLQIRRVWIWLFLFPSDFVPCMCKQNWEYFRFENTLVLLFLLLLKRMLNLIISSFGMTIVFSKI